MLWNKLELLYSLRKGIGAGPPIVKFLLFIIGKKIWNQNNVEFDLSMETNATYNALVLFPFFWIINKKCTVDHVRPSPYPKKFT